MSDPATKSVIAELGPNMTVQDMKLQAKARLELASTIEAKYEGAITSADDEAQVKKLLGEVDILEDRIQALEEKESRSRRIQDGLDKYTRPVRPAQGKQGGDESRELSPGDQFTRDAAYLGLLHRGGFNSPLNALNFAVQMKDGTSLIQWTKALLYGSSDSVGGAWVPEDLRPGAVDIRQREINVLDLIPRLQTSSDTIEYVREDTYTNAAAMVAEATATTGTSGTKPESTLAFSVQTSPVRTLAHWLPVTNRMLADAPAIRGYINSRLLLGLTLALEGQIITGDGTGENLTGILNSGITAIARGSDNETDAIFKARTIVRTGGKLRPSAIIMNPGDFQQVRLLRENAASATLGQYLMGPPSMLGPTTVWGIPVVESEAMTENTVLVGAFDQGSTLFDREQSAVRVGTINDQMIRNMQTVLAEQRLAFVTWRPSAFVRVTGY